MSKHCVEADETGVFVDGGGLDDSNGLATEALAHDLKTA
jgi:hypothetical protein